jgi:hypothetical protein
MAIRVGLSIIVFSALFLVSWLVFMPVGALVVAPLTVASSLLLGVAPSAAVNSAAAVSLSGGFAGVTVLAALRVLLRRARVRARRAAAPLA